MRILLQDRQRALACGLHILRRVKGMRLVEIARICILVLGLGVMRCLEGVLAAAHPDIVED